ncbi:MAG: FAD-binding oxidoreductase, partial [bacterium]|nr:FAD-binding oxidoreductase [bacterium]
MVPRTKLPELLRFVREVAERTGLTISNIFHAGDGNLHPIILFDMRKPGDMEKAQRAGEEILERCIDAGGSITGEHGVGMEKIQLMARQFSPESIQMMANLKKLFDPDGRLNPGKVLPAGAV